MQVIYIFISLYKNFQLLHPLLQEVRLVPLRPHYQEVLLVLVPVVVVHRGDNYNAPRVLVHLDRMLLVVVVLQVAVLASLGREDLLNAQLVQYHLEHLRRQTGVDEQVHLLDGVEAAHELLDLGDGEHGLVEVPQAEHAPVHFLQQSVVGAHPEGQVAGFLFFCVLDEEVLDFDSQDYLALLDVFTIVHFVLALAGFLELVAGEQQED